MRKKSALKFSRNDPTTVGSRYRKFSSIFTTEKSRKTQIGDQTTMIRFSNPYEEQLQDVIMISQKTSYANRDADDPNASTAGDTNNGLSSYYLETASNTSFDADWKELPYETLQVNTEDEVEDEDETRKEKLTKKSRGVSWKEQTDEFFNARADDLDSGVDMCVDGKKQKKKKKMASRHFIIQIRKKKKLVNNSTQISILSDDSDSESSTIGDLKPSPRPDNDEEAPIPKKKIHKFRFVRRFVKKHGSSETKSVDKAISPMTVTALTNTEDDKDVTEAGDSEIKEEEVEEEEEEIEKGEEEEGEEGVEEEESEKEIKDEEVEKEWPHSEKPRKVRTNSQHRKVTIKSARGRLESDMNDEPKRRPRRHVRARRSSRRRQLNLDKFQ